MIAWVCPADTVRSTPRRISRLPSRPSGPGAGSATLTCRSRISRVAITYLLIVGCGRGGAERDVDVAVLDLHRVDGHGLGGGRPGRAAGAQVETRPVQPAFHRVVVDLALGQRDLLVRAHVVQGEHLIAGAHHGDRHAVDLHPEAAVVGHVGQRAGPDELRGLVHRRTSPAPAASSASMATVMRSRSSGTAILAISSPKKPRMTSRRASSSGMPRAIR